MATTKKPAATGAAAKTDATALLERDHRDVKKLFKQYGKLADAEASGEERQALATQICTMLTVHATIEEEIFYPAARAAGIDDSLMDEADVEHAAAKDLIAQIRAMTPDEDHYDAKVKVLGEQIEHHVEEEQDEMFPKCRGAGMDLAGLGKALAARKEELMQEASEEIVGGAPA
jgi:hemerythrin superfamily protein